VPRFTKEDIELQVLADYRELAGKVVLLTEVEGYDERGISETVACDPPAIGRVVTYNAKDIGESVLRWMDGDNCDPLYEVWILERHPAFNDMSPSWVYGTSRSTDGTVSPGGVTLAPADIQRKYLHTPGLPNKRVGDCGVPEPSFTV